MPNYLKEEKKQQVSILLELGWSYRRIEAETGVRRETISRYDKERPGKAAKVFAGSGESESSENKGFCEIDASKAAKVTTGSASKAAKVTAGSSPRARSLAAPYHDAIANKLSLELSARRIWQDLVTEYGCNAGYESVKRYIRKLPRPTIRAAGVFHTAPGEEGQVDFFQGAPTLDGHSGQWKRPWVFRLTLCYSRHGYEEAAWDQSLETFLRLHENAFADLGGVPLVIRHDNLKAAVTRACFHDPDSNTVYAEFARHWGFTPLPTRPRHPQENGKAERSGGYVKDNALKGRKFNSLAEHNEYLRHWNRTIGRLRIHGTTRRQVWTHFLETDKPALQPLAPEPFRFFKTGLRCIHPDGHVEVEGAFYPAPLHLMGQQLRVRWDRNLVRLYDGETQVAVYRRLDKGQYASRHNNEPCAETPFQRAFVARLLTQCERVGMPLREWAAAALAERGVRAIRMIQGVAALTRKYPREWVLAAAHTALSGRLFRYKDLLRLTEQHASTAKVKPLITQHSCIRPMTDYCLEDLL